jgi:hypothetical protein
MSQGNQFTVPKMCHASGAGCKSTRFAEYGDKQYSDFQEIKVGTQNHTLSYLERVHAFAFCQTVSVG